MKKEDKKEEIADNTVLPIKEEQLAEVHTLSV